MLFYILDETDHPKQVSEAEWADWFQQHKTIIRTSHIGNIRIRTIFKSHLMGDLLLNDPPVWETKVRGGPLHDETQSCAGSKDNALKMHSDMVERVKTIINGHQTN